MEKAFKPSLILKISCITWIIALGAVQLSPHLEQSLFGPDKNSIAHLVDQSVLISGQVISTVLKADQTQLVLDDLIADGTPRDDRLLMFVPRYPELTFGDIISLRCDLARPLPFDGFRYDQYLASRDIFALCYSYQSPLHIGQAPKSFTSTLMSFRARALSATHQLFEEPSSYLLAGLIFGADELNDDWQTDFRRTGTAHITVASGYNIGLVVYWIVMLSAYFGIRRQRVFGVVGLGLVAYVMIAGGEAPVVRAAILASVVLIANYVERKSNGFHLWLLVGAIMLLFNPLLLFYDVGWQLSMLSTFGLLVVEPRLRQFLLWLPERYELRKSLSSTLSATLSTLPVTVFSFGNFSPIAPIANLLILPLIPFSMLSGLLAITIASANSLVGLWFSVLPSALLKYILVIISSLSRLPFAYVAR